MIATWCPCSERLQSICIQTQTTATQTSSPGTRSKQPTVKKTTHDLRAWCLPLGADSDEVETDLWDLERWRSEAQHLESRVGMEERKLDRLRKEEPFNIAEQVGR